ncbi:hypothetical protein [Psittacicella hinzii]|uniref:Uncharacterized protein n=1 Tax=Psittacicella hinzii TaxID=2028575 RepID=A0A3A1YPK6_9GAMM|nr:hypothetical protein [Psittacicella hinzii]RIY39179.1 hypothetical protein CKF58_02605 [Psittacicella hinzii]
MTLSKKLTALALLGAVISTPLTAFADTPSSAAVPVAAQSASAANKMPSFMYQGEAPERIVKVEVNNAPIYGALFKQKLVRLVIIKQSDDAVAMQTYNLGDLAVKAPVEMSKETINQVLMAFDLKERVQ